MENIISWGNLIKDVKKKFETYTNAKSHFEKEELKITIKKHKKKSRNIPKPLRIAVWETYISKRDRFGACICCGRTLDIMDFHCGHVISHNMGGPANLSNLRPVCSVCNLSMGDMHLMHFKFVIGLISLTTYEYELLREAGVNIHSSIMDNNNYK